MSSEDSPDDLRAVARYLQDALPEVASVIASGVASSVAGPEGAVLGAALLPLFRGMTALDRRHQARAVEVVASAAACCDNDIEGLVRWAEESAPRLDFLGRVVDAATRTAEEAHLQALARVLAEVVQDEARLDVAPLYIDALATMTPADVRVLRLMIEKSNWNLELIEGGGGAVDWQPAQLAEALPELFQGIDALVARLQQLGCIAPKIMRWDWPPGLVVTTFGRLCLAYLREVEFGE